MTKKIKPPVKKRLTTAIEWVLNSDGTAGYAINLWIGCSKISPACDNCYAEISRVSTCMGVKWGNDAERKKCNPYKKLTAINKKAAKQGIRIRVFINPDSDIFDNKAPQEWRNEFWDFIESTPCIDYILVTKRIGNAKFMLSGNDCVGYVLPKNVWIMITVCNQAEADRDIPKLLELDVTVRGLSIEPLLGEIDFLKIDGVMIGGACGGGGETGAVEYDFECSLNWIIIGGESGKNARPMNSHWARKIRDQCVGAGVSMFFKQWGEWVGEFDNQVDFFEHDDVPSYFFQNNIPPYSFKDNLPNSGWMYRVGKKLAGNLLDGQVWQQMPELK